MADRMQLVQSIAATIADYRADEPFSFVPRGEKHVEKWVAQFDPGVQLAVLLELNHVLERAYINKEDAKEFLVTVSEHADFAGFWKETKFLDLQRNSSSQREMLELLSECLRIITGLKVDDCGLSAVRHYLYIDDVVFTGNRVLRDLTGWIQTSAPQKATLHIVVMAHHRLGQWYADEALKRVCADAGKSIDIQWLSMLEIENRLKYKETSDVFWPASLPDDTETQKYAAAIPRQLEFRPGSLCGELAYFSSPSARNLLEQELLKAGVRVRNKCPNLSQAHRPLGYTKLETLGFGATVVTFRNCPNNTPLALWVDRPWYPLFPRKNNKRVAG